MYRILRKAVKVIRSFSALLWLLFLVLLVGALLISFESIDSGKPMLAGGTFLISGVLLAVVYKSHVAAAEARLVRQEIRATSRRFDAMLSQLVNDHGSEEKGENRSNSRTSHALNPNSREIEVAKKSSKNSRKKRIAVVGTPELKCCLEGSFEVTSLHPGIAEPLFEAERPSALLVEEAALFRGSWKNTLTDPGKKLLTELLNIRNQAVAANLQVFLLPTPNTDKSTHLLRDSSTILLNETYLSTFWEPTQGGSRGDLLSGLVSCIIRYKNGERSLSK